MTFSRIQSFFSSRHTLELLPLILIVSLLPFFHGGESFIAQLVFFIFPLLYFPILHLSKRKFSANIKYVMLIWILFLSITFLSTVFSASLTFSLPIFFRYLTYFVYFVFVYLVVERERDLRIFSHAILTVGVLLSAMSVYFIFFPPIGMPVLNLVYAKYGHNHLADYLTFTLPVAIVIYFEQKSLVGKFFSALLLVFLFISFYFSFARAAFLIVPVIIVILIKLVHPPLNKAVFVLIGGLLPILIFLGITFLSESEFQQRFSSFQELQKHWIWRQIIKPVSSEARFEYWNQAKEGFLFRPLIGNGPGTFRLTSNRFKQKDIYSHYAHNYLLQTASELGLAGLLSLLAVFVLILLNISLPKKSSHLSYALLFGSIGSLGQSFFNFNMDLVAISLLFWVVLSMLLKLYSGKSLRQVHARILKVFLFVIIFPALFAVSTLLSNYYLRLAKKHTETSIQLAYKSYVTAMIFPAFDELRFGGFLNFIQSTQYVFSEDIPLGPILFWNREDPLTYAELASYYKSSDPLEAMSYYSKSLEYDPANFSTAKQFAQFLIEQNDHNLAERVLLRAGMRRYLTLFSKEEDQQFHKHIATDRNLLSLKDISMFLDDFTQHEDRYYGKLYYLVGLHFFQEGKFPEAQFFLDASHRFAPDWSYFYLEHANLLSRIGDNNQAFQLIDICQKNYWAGSQCQDYNGWVKQSGFPFPGRFEREIRKIDH